MPVISDSTINYVNDHIDSMSPEQVQQIWNAFSKEQPALIGYVLGESQELESPDAREDTAYILTVILLSFRETQPNLPTITETAFELAFHREFDKMETVFHDGFDETEAMNMVDTFCQPALLGFVAAIIYGEVSDNEESNFTEEEAGLFVVIFKTIIELLHQKMSFLR